MRINIATFLILISCLNVFSKASAQKINLQFKQVELETVFKAIEKQVDLGFAYGVALLANSQPVTVNLKNVTLTEALDHIFKNLPYKYEIVNKTILIKAKAMGGTQPSPLDTSNPIKIHGKVSDLKGRDLPGVSIRVRGQNVGSITDQNGNYSIESEPDGILVFSSVGYQTMQIKINNQPEINLTLPELTAQLKEITIQTGYEKITPERFVGSATVVDSVILQRQVSTDLFSRLDGTTNSLLFNKTGSSLPLLQLRGISTLGQASPDINGQALSNPLIILDDFPYTGDIASINPNDIEKITFLKDAAAASIWGAKAGNGVIVITTKKGKYEHPLNVTITSSIQFKEKPDLRYFPQMSSSDFIEVEQFLFDKGYQDPLFQFPQFYIVSPAVEIMNKRKKGEISNDEAARQLNLLKSYDVINDYDKYVLRNAINKQNYLSLTGGSSLLNYNVSLGADNNLTSIKGSGRDDRYTINTSLNLSPFKFLEVSSAVNYVYENSIYDGLFPSIISPNGGARTKIFPYARFADDEGNHLSIPYKYTLSFIESQNTQKLLDWTYKPLDEKDYSNNRLKANSLRINLGTKFKLTDWVNIDLKYQFSQRTVATRNLMDERTFFTRDLINNFTTTGTFKRNVPLGGVLDQGSSELRSQNVRSQLNINKTWNSLHALTALLAAEVGDIQLSKNKFRVLGYDDNILAYSTQTDYLTPYPLYFGGTQQIPNNIELSERKDKLVSLIANASYTYNSIYSIYASARRDGSNLFGVKTNNRWKPLWSIGGRYNIAKENYFNIPWINTLAIRGSFGYSGNVNNTISALATMTYASSLNRDQQTVAFLNSPPNPDLRWEEVGTTNFGIDYSILNSRISGSIDLYRKQSKDVIAAMPIDPTVGVLPATVMRNAANLKTNGIDLSLNTINIDRKFKWSSQFNYSYGKTIVSKYFQNFIITPLGSGIREGDIYGGIYAYKWAGLDPNNGDPRGFLGKTLSKDYNKIFLDSAINQEYIGSPFPLHFGNVLNTISFKKIDISFNISYRYAYHFRKTALRYDRLYEGWVGHSDYINRWKNKGDELITTVPSLPYPVNSSRDQFYEYSEINYEKGDHIRLQDIRISYSLTNTRYNIPIKSIQLYVYAGNLNVMIWKASKSGFDPDYPLSQVPPVRNITLGARINL